MAKKVYNKDKFKTELISLIPDSNIMSICQNKLNDISQAVGGTGAWNGSFSMGCHGKISGASFALEEDNSAIDKYGKTYKIKLKMYVTNHNSTKPPLLVYLDYHNPEMRYNINYTADRDGNGVSETITNGILNNTAVTQSFLNGQTETMTWVGDHFEVVISPSKGMWYATCSCQSEREGSNGNKFAGHSTGCGPHLNLPLIVKNINSTLSFTGLITKDGDGDPYDSSVKVAKLGSTQVNIPHINNVDEITYGIFETNLSGSAINVNINSSNLKISRFDNPIGVLDANRFNTSTPADGYGGIIKTQKTVTGKFTLPGDLNATPGKQYIMVLSLMNRYGYSNFAMTPVFTVQHKPPKILEWSVSLDENNPLSGIKVYARSDNDICFIDVRITAKTNNDGEPVWSGYDAFRIAPPSGRKSYTEEIEMRDTVEETIPKNPGHTWYNTKYYVKIRIQADNEDYLWSSNWSDAPTRSITTKNIASFNTYPNMVMGQDKTSDVKIRVAEGVKYQVVTSLPGSITKNQPASITKAGSTHTADNPLTINGVNITKAEWDTIYKQLPGGVNNLPANVTSDQANKLSVTAKVISYYNDGTKAGEKSLSSAKTISLINANSKARTVRMKNGNIVKAGMAYAKSGGVVKKCVIWKKESSRVERGVINGNVR